MIKTLCVIGLMLLSACSPGTGKQQRSVPADVIPHDQMVLILTEVMLTEAALHQIQMMGKNVNSYTRPFYDSIFATYQISRERFESSIDYYADDPKRLDEIYAEVITNLSKKQSEINLKK